VTTQFVKTELTSERTVLRIDRLDHRNRINEAAIGQLRDGLRRAHELESPLVVLTGTDDLFCTGGAVDGYPAEFSVERHQAYSRAFVDLLIDMGRSRIPIIARVNGDCLAGGTMLLNRCDLAIAVDSAEFGLPELEFGGFPMLALATAIEQFPAKLIFDMAYLGRRISASEALGLHLINRVVPADQLDLELDSVAAILRSRSSASIGFGRQAFYSLLRDQTEARLEQARAELTVSAASQAVRGAAEAPARG